MSRRNAMQQESEQLFETTWGRIVKALEEVYGLLLGEVKQMNKENVANKMQWYQIVYNASTRDQLVADKIYHKLREWLATTLEDRVAKPVIAKAREGDGDELFRTVTRAYQNYRTCISFGKIVFGYLGTYVTKRSGNDSVETMYLKAFNAAVYNNVKDSLRTVILRQVNSRRDGNQVDLSALKAAVGIFIDVGTSTAADEKAAQQVYNEDFEKDYLQSLREVSRRRANVELTSEGGHYTYLKWVETRQELEKFLATELLRPSSLEAVVAATEDEMLAPHYQTIVGHPESGCAVLLEDWKEQDLARMYRLMKRIKNQAALQIMGEELKKRVVQEGAALMAEFCATTADGPMSVEKPLVSAVVELNNKYGRLIKTHFEGSALFYKFRKEGFSAFLATKLTRIDPKPSGGEGATETKDTSFSEVLATYLDAVMKRELKDVIDAEAELERLDDLLRVFTYIVEKDVFAEFYKAKLAKRLLHTTPNEDLEKAFLERLQREMAKSYTHKMEGMLQDRESTKVQSEKFKLDPLSKALTCEFDVQVLTEANWPSYKTDAMVPPASLRKCVDMFTLFYKKHHQTRKLTWINILGSATMVISFPKGTKDVTASLHQAAVLVTVDELGKASVDQVAQALGFDPKAVKPHIASMYLHKTMNVLQKVDGSGEALPAAKTIQDDDLFALNRAFVFKTRKFKLAVAMTSAANSAGMPTDGEIDGRRKIQVQAAIVRIMKSKKTLEYQELQDQVIQQLGRLFTPQPKLIKVCTEELVTREYLRRHEDNPKKFDYLA